MSTKTPLWALAASFVNTVNGKLFGAVGKTRWLDFKGTERLIRDTGPTTGTPPQTNGPSKEEVLATPSYIPEGCVMTDDEILSLPIHLTDGSVCDPRKMFNGVQVEAALRTRRDLEVMAVRKANERGLINRIPENKTELHARLLRNLQQVCGEGE